MSQLVAAASARGLVLAADRRVVVLEGAVPRLHSVTKLFALGRSAAVATSGAAIGVATSRWAAAMWAGRAPLPFPELADWVRSAFQSRYEDFGRRGETWFRDHPEAHRLSYILLGGWTPEGKPTFRFEASESAGEAYRPVPTGRILTAPRRLGLEGRLQRLIQRDPTAEELSETIVEGLRLIARKEASAVGGPFDLALFDANGMRLEKAE